MPVKMMFVPVYPTLARCGDATSVPRRGERSDGDAARYIVSPRRLVRSPSHFFPCRCERKDQQLLHVKSFPAGRGIAWGAAIKARALPQLS